MDSTRPFLLLRARVSEGERERFARWFRAVHLRDIERIPGVAGVQSGRTPGGTQLGFYSFESGESVQAALSSPEAAYARGTWEQWEARLEEFFVEMWAPLAPLSIYQARS